MRIILVFTVLFCAHQCFSSPQHSTGGSSGRRSSSPVDDEDSLYGSGDGGVLIDHRTDKLPGSDSYQPDSRSNNHPDNISNSYQPDSRSNGNQPDSRSNGNQPDSRSNGNQPDSRSNGNQPDSRSNSYQPDSSARLPSASSQPADDSNDVNYHFGRDDNQPFDDSNFTYDDEDYDYYGSGEYEDYDEYKEPVAPTEATTTTTTTTTTPKPIVIIPSTTTTTTTEPTTTTTTTTTTPPPATTTTIPTTTTTTTTTTTERPNNIMEENGLRPSEDKAYEAGNYYDEEYDGDYYDESYDGSGDYDDEDIANRIPPTHKEDNDRTLVHHYDEYSDPVTFDVEKPVVPKTDTPRQKEIEPTTYTEVERTTPPSSGGMDTVGGMQIVSKEDNRDLPLFAQPGIVAAFIGGAIVGLLCAILLVMFVVYRMRKKDEGSYPLDEPKRVPLTSSYATTDKEIYA